MGDRLILTVRASLCVRAYVPPCMLVYACNTIHATRLGHHIYPTSHGGKEAYVMTEEAMTEMWENIYIYLYKSCSNDKFCPNRLPMICNRSRSKWVELNLLCIVHAYLMSSADMFREGPHISIWLRPGRWNALATSVSTHLMENHRNAGHFQCCL